MQLKHFLLGLVGTVIIYNDNFLNSWIGFQDRPYIQLNTFLLIEGANYCTYKIFVCQDFTPKVTKCSR